MVLLLICLLPAAGMSASAGELYRQADLHYKQFSNSPALKKKRTERPNCTSFTELVYRLYPNNLM
jgi:hypothetical protein